ILPFLVFALFRRFLPLTWALALTFVFAAVPVGALFGSSLVQYIKWAARGFADPAAYIFFLAAFVLLLGREAHSVRSLSPLGRGRGEGVRSPSIDLNPSPHPSPYGRGSRPSLSPADSTSDERAPDEGPRDRFDRAFGAGLLFALALFVRPNIAPAA